MQNNCIVNALYIFIIGPTLSPFVYIAVIVRFASSRYSYNENGGTGSVEVVKDGNTIGSLTVRVVTGKFDIK